MRLGKYEILKEIDKGGFGVVYHALDTVLQVERALKVLHPALIVDPQAAARFMSEAQMAALLEHPHIVPVYDIGEAEGRVFMAMKFMACGSLKNLLEREGKLPYQDAIVIIGQVAHGVDFAHQKGVVHRDLKPGNILFDENGMARVSDFGFAKVLSETKSNTLSVSGGILGTPAYMAPELWNGTPPPSLATDVYALACVFFEMLTGEVLFKGDIPGQLITKHLMVDVQALMESCQDEIPALVKPIIEKALAKDQKSRYQDVNSFFEALVEAQKPPQTEVQSEPLWDFEPDQPAEPAVTSKTVLPVWAVWVIAAALALSVLVGGLVLLTRGSQDRIPAAATEPTSVIFSSMINPVDGAQMVYVPEGEFLMGSVDADASDHEKQRNKVYLDAFWIYQHLVTNAQFAVFIDATGYQTTVEEKGWSWVVGGTSRTFVYKPDAYWGEPEGPGSNVAGRAEHPVVQVSWFDAAAYCEWVGGRLPADAEWEKAGRGTDGRMFPWGDEPVTGDRANFCDVNCPTEFADTDQDDQYERTSPVGSYPLGASPYGVLDMAGNVWEWVADYYRRSPYENPTGPTDGDKRVLRGGSWIDNGLNLRVTSRGWTLTYSDDATGFRCLINEAP